MEIKKEVSYSEEIITLDDDFTICISDDESGDNESNQWAGKLSQDQDFVVKKVTESTESKKRKAAKQIEAMPLIPSKRGRRNSVSSNVASTSSKTSTTTTTSTAQPLSTKQTSKEKNEPIHTNHSTASNGAPVLSTAHSLNTSVAPTVKNTQKTFVDRFDPYAKKIKEKTEKPKLFEDAIAFNIVEPKKRIAIRPKPRLMSILRKENGSWPSELSTHGKKAKSIRRVHFSEAHFIEVREYEPNDNENNEIIIAAPIKPTKERAAHTVQSNSFENDPLHEIITDITEWKTEWLLQRNVTPPINGVNLIICPLLNAYASFENYKE